MIGHPLHGFVEHRIETYVGNLLHVAGGGIANPKLDGISSNVDESEALTVCGPGGVAGTHAGGKRNWSLPAVGDPNESKACCAGSNAVAAGRVVLAVIFGFNASTGKAEERLRDASDGRIILPGNQEDGVVGGANEGDGWRGRTHHGQDVVWGQVVA